LEAMADNAGAGCCLRCAGVKGLEGEANAKMIVSCLPAPGAF
jgi:hypothetical protein